MHVFPLRNLLIQLQNRNEVINMEKPSQSLQRFVSLNMHGHVNGIMVTVW